jgi:hypothetical protein
MKTIVLAIAGPCLMTALLAGCTTVYSQLDGTRYHRVPIDTYPVVVTRVDGESYLRNPVLVEPGLRKIMVQGPPTFTSRDGDLREFSLDVKPCTHYHLVAVKRNALSNDFTVKVDHESPLSSCAATVKASSIP